MAYRVSLYLFVLSKIMPVAKAAKVPISTVNMGTDAIYAKL